MVNTCMLHAWRHCVRTVRIVGAWVSGLCIDAVRIEGAVTVGTRHTCGMGLSLCMKPTLKRRAEARPAAAERYRTGIPFR